VTLFPFAFISIHTDILSALFSSASHRSERRLRTREGIASDDTRGLSGFSSQSVVAQKKNL
jgi:hypothetical protein